VIARSAPVSLSWAKNKGHPPVASGRLVEMRAYGLNAVRLFQALLLGGRS
jgi:hypothetical protein